MVAILVAGKAIVSWFARSAGASGGPGIEVTGSAHTVERQATWLARARQTVLGAQESPTVDAQALASPNHHVPGDRFSIQNQTFLHSSKAPVIQPQWAIPYGREFWRQSAVATPPGTKGSAHVRPDLDLSDVIDRVSHAIQTSKTSMESYVFSRAYTAAFGPEGLRFSPRLAQEDSPTIAGSAARHFTEPVSRLSDRDWQEADPPTMALIRTVSVQCDGRDLYRCGKEPKSWVVFGNTVQELLNREIGLVEHYEVRQAGVEMSWVLCQPPAAGGPLRIEAELSGLVHAGQSVQGHNFADDSGILRVRIGAVRLIDFSGKSTAVPIEVCGQTLRIDIPGPVLASSSYPLAIDPLISAEFGMDQPVIGPAPGNQVMVRVTSNGTNYFVVWSDERSGSRELYGTRITRAGIVLDPLGLRLLGAVAGWDLASNGKDYLIVWQDRWTNPTIYGTRVRADGRLLSNETFRIAMGSNPAVASDGTGYLVLWQNWHGDVGINAIRVGSEAALIHTNVLTIAAGNEDDHCRLAGNRNGYLIVWERWQGYGESRFANILARRVGPDGILLDQKPIPISSGTSFQWNPNVASDGTNYLVTWLNRNALYATTVSHDGLVGGSRSLIGPRPAASFLSSNGREYLLLWQEISSNCCYSAIYAARLSPSGELLEKGPFRPAPTNRLMPAAGSIGQDHLVAWADDRGTPEPHTSDLYAACVIDGAIDATNAFKISFGANAQLSPSVASSRNNYLVVWEDYRNRNGYSYNAEIYGTRLSRDGRILDPFGLPLAVGDVRASNPAVASDGEEFFVAWQDWRAISNRFAGADIFGTRVTSEGVILHTNGVTISAAPGWQLGPKVASNGDGYFVAWEDDRNDRSIYGARLTKEGLVLDPDSVRLTTGPRNSDVSVTANGTDYFVVWRNLLRPLGGTELYHMDIFGARVSVDGVVLDSPPIAISTNWSQKDFPVVASAGRDYLVTWTETTVYHGPSTAMAAQIGTDGAFLKSPFRLTISTNSQVFPTVAGANGNYLVVWQQPSQCDYRLCTATDLYGTRVTDTGILLDPEGFATATTGNTQQRPAVVGDGSTFLILYPGPGETGSIRVRGKLISGELPPIFSHLARLSAGGFAFTLSGATGRTYGIEISSNLLDWVLWRTLTNVSSELQLQESITSSLPLRFYRARLLHRALLDTAGRSD